MDVIVPKTEQEKEEDRKRRIKEEVSLREASERRVGVGTREGERGGRSLELTF